MSFPVCIRCAVQPVHKYADKLLDAGSYNSKKVATFSSSFRAGYAFKHINMGLGMETGNYQTKKETEITGLTTLLSSFVSSTSFVTATGRYLTPHIFVHYQTNIWKKFTLETGLMTGILLSGFEKDNGLLVLETDAVLGIIPAQTLAVEAHTGRIGQTVSTNIVSGAQLLLGYDATDRLKINLEFAARFSSIDARASVLGYEQPFSYALFYMPIRAGISYSFTKRTNPEPAVQAE